MMIIGHSSQETVVIDISRLLPLWNVIFDVLLKERKQLFEVRKHDLHYSWLDLCCSIPSLDNDVDSPELPYGPKGSQPSQYQLPTPPL